MAQTTGLFFNDPAASDGYVLFAPNTSMVTYLMDKDANIVNQWVSAYTPGLIAYLQPDGSLLRDAALHGQGGNGSINAAGAGGLLERFDWNGTKNWEFSYDSATHLAHHDFEVMPNGNILLIAWELKTEAEATQAGRDPNLAGAGYLYPDHIVEVQPDYINGGGTVVWEWHIWNHLVQEFDATKNNWYGATGVDDHPELIDINYVSDAADGGGQREDWTHANGIDYNEQLDQIVLSVREFSEFWIIDHSTTTAEAATHAGGNSGRGGDLLYRWGNPEAYDRGTAGDRKLYFQHDAKWIDDGSPGAGHITAFNNGFGRPGTDFSAVEEITTPVDVNGNYPISPGLPFGPTSSFWTYTAALDDYSAIISGAKRLPNGNTFITYGVDGTFTEIDAAGTEVWRFVNPYTGFGQIGMNDPIPSMGFTDPGLDALRINFTFQATPYPVGYVPQLSSSVVGRHIFYNQSVWDGNSAAIDAVNDNAAIATDKSAYLPGAGLAVVGNITSFSRGINGIMIDLSSGFDHLGITLANVANNFVFKVGNNNTPGSWAAGPAPAAISVITGGGVSGSDRVEITWASGSINNKWLEVQVLSTTQTGLQAPDVFFWGNKIADSGTGTPAGSFDTTTTDSAQVFATLGAGKPITDLRDYNRDGQVTTTDAAIVFANLGSLVRINIGTAGPFAPEGDGDAGIASALASTATMSIASSNGPVPQSVATPSESGVTPGARIAESLGQLFDEQRADNSAADDRDVDLSIVDLDDELLHTLASAL